MKTSIIAFIAAGLTAHIALANPMAHARDTGIICTCDNVNCTEPPSRLFCQRELDCCPGWKELPCDPIFPPPNTVGGFALCRLPLEDY
ncbi:hypothetical protein AGABI1DRAFT_112950 [Agaricus bisporus var. burnettii JB137-S8]|uniref:Uncharacterized protein n=1 Tax=Agaricus bisporus var. burnettii (strain JB137-S8 / ATCC MYA-4627 / FGSC 10392) TaxID=597362 RepID=K5XDP5_AGABU|nr:uncharacterized protein AGABI1DRAFT_112950 [Agaricus bisporus var. burnettii JB137-S8]EKM81287.1 hypothetical protein AGABI1DRAFT_112950 [Agaricus bisporus var. burnettii JB137-S8]